LAETWTVGRIIRLNTIAEVNRQYAESLGVKDTPTFILFDATGQEQQRWLKEAPSLAELPHKI
jgi:DTW domain-containing protein YfiP